MEKPLILESIDSPRNGIRYKRRLWLGLLGKDPYLSDNLHNGSFISIQHDILTVGLFPTLLAWDQIDGTKKFAEVKTPYDPTKKTTRRKLF